MKITKVSTLTVQGNFDWLLVRVNTDEGISGIGECYGTRNSDQIKHYVSTLGEQLIGENPLNIARLTLKMGLGSVSGHKVNAISGIEIALWDLAGKALGIPVYTLLGGNLQSKV